MKNKEPDIHLTLYGGKVATTSHIQIFRIELLQQEIRILLSFFLQRKRLQCHRWQAARALRGHVPFGGRTLVVTSNTRNNLE